MRVRVRVCVCACVRVRVRACVRAAPTVVTIPSQEKPPFLDIQPRLEALLRAYGPTRLMWGSDFPFCLPGGFPLPEGVESTPAALSYADAAKAPDMWTSVRGLDEEARAALMGGTAAKLFGFEVC